MLRRQSVSGLLSIEAVADKICVFLPNILKIKEYLFIQSNIATEINSNNALNELDNIHPI